ncbi:MAG: sulfatase-like hydrolase/transferase [Verrucomicrobiota bacterium]
MRFFWTILFTLLAPLSMKAESRPNILFIMADDLGWADTTLYGHTTLHETPHLQRLAERGMLFHRAYTSSPLCSPTRSAVLTGLHPARTGLTAPTCHIAGDPILRPSLNPRTPKHQPLLNLVKPNRLDTNYPSIAKTLKTAGYTTAHFGKWHLGLAPFTALDHGFDIDIPHWHGPGPAGSYVAPWKFKDFDEAYPGEHIEDRMGDEIVTFLNEHQDSDSPFFINYWQFSVHGPFNAKEEYIESYRDKVDPENDEQHSPTYAAMVKSLDDNIGKVLDALDSTGLADNTLIFFYSDNGGNMYSDVEGTYPTSNRPLRGGKGNNWDGGVRVPGIAVWPGKIEPGSESHQRITSTDFFPTFLDLLDLEKPKDQIFDGISIAPALKGEKLDRDYTFTYFPHSTKVPDSFSNNVAVYDEEWKLIRLLHGGKDREHEHWLFHLKSDIGETTNVADQHPEKVKELSAALDDFLDRTGATYPTPNPNYVPPKKPNAIVIYTDDHGWPDIQSAGIYDDLKTPHLDALAASGVRATSGYSSAPQCVPSRGGLLTGKYQNRFRLESNGESLDGFNKELTIAERLKKVGYATGQVGKWHLGATKDITDHGFDDVYAKNANRPCSANFTLSGETVPMQVIDDSLYHLDACSDAAVTFIDRHKDEPFFLYLAYRAPHVPLDAPEKYLSRFPGEMPERRRQALAMISAMDDGVGKIVAKLKAENLTEETLIFFIGDNGAPLKIHKLDAPGGGPGWDGSLNEPMNGEKGMLSEGGIRVPYLISWPGTIPKGQIHDAPVTALDATATIIKQAGILLTKSETDGIDLLPQLTGKPAPKRKLYWRWINQSAIRDGQWKLLRGGPRAYLFNIEKDPGETKNLKDTHQATFARLEQNLDTWAAKLPTPGVDKENIPTTLTRYYDHYLEGKPVELPQETATNEDDFWKIRGGKGKVEDGQLVITSNPGKAPFITAVGIPAGHQITVTARTDGGPFAMAWRLKEEKDFVTENRVEQKVESRGQSQEIRFDIPKSDNPVHLRLHLPTGITTIEKITLEGPQNLNWEF